MALNTRIGPTAVAAALGLAALASAGSAQAITCVEVAQNAPGALKDHVIYGAGGSAITATLAKVALTLSKADPPILVFYADPGAQQGYNYFRDGTGAGKTGSEFKFGVQVLAEGCRSHRAAEVHCGGHARGPSDGLWHDW
jgi:hypothetical protein